MPDRLPPQRTPWTTQELFTALGTAWSHYFNSSATREQLCLLLAHVVFETGWGRGCWNFNLGNAKSVVGDGYDYTFFACTEDMSIAQAKALVDNPHAIGRIEVVSTTAAGRATCRFFPDHPACRFRAFRTLPLGCLDYLTLLVRRFSDANPERDAWRAVLAADPSAFCHALKLKNYYTADEGIYTRQVVGTYQSLLQKNFDMSGIADLDAEEQDQLQNWKTSTTGQGLEEALAADRILDPDTLPQ